VILNTVLDQFRSLLDLQQVPTPPVRNLQAQTSRLNPSSIPTPDPPPPTPDPRPPTPELRPPTPDP
jgi:hypothetical protein